MSEATPATAGGDSRASFWSGLTLVLAPLLSVFAMAHHPSTGGSGTAERLRQMSHEAGVSAVVHGALIALAIATLIGFFTVAGRLGWQSGRVRAGAVAYSIGVVCMVGAALVSGFVVSGMAQRYVDATPAEMEAALPAFHLAHAANQALAKTGAVAMSAGILFWSLVMLGRHGLLRGLGALGVPIALVPIAGLVAGYLRLDVHGMLLVVLGQSLWTLGVGVWLLRGGHDAKPATSP
ncbi:MAG: hypothetical protein OES32_06750 [Acidobacteriota bacterium]|nr:hypothetical protein [Acidobacteriota bacterium]